MRGDISPEEIEALYNQLKSLYGAYPDMEYFPIHFGEVKEDDET